MIVSVTSPATLNVSLPRPPITVVTIPWRVLRMKKESLPSRPSTSMASSTPSMRMLSPAPKMPSSVMTKASSISVPSATTVSKPEPPLMLTGALTLYSKRSSASPPLARISFSATKARITKVSLPASPSRRITALLL